MQYISTRSNYDKVSVVEAIKIGMVPEGGLFVPEYIPRLSKQELENLVNKGYQRIAEKILSMFLTDFTLEEIKDCINKAYNYEKFDNKYIAPLYKLTEDTYILELWHGPTAAFKDMALQIMPYFLSLAMEKMASDEEVVILVATSGDTGKAALEGFKNVPKTKIIVFYPQDGVSKVQELQMTTTEGQNTYVVAVEGNFDDCQRTVKEIFADKKLVQELLEKGFQLSSANSINWGRLLPQIIYYFASYMQLVAKKDLKMGEKVNFVVPTGNFGNILAGWYAYKMGLPVHKFICASNENKVLTDFFQNGHYDKNRDFKRTNSPSMDILVSSNLERFLFELTGHDGQKIKQWMEDLQTKGSFQIDKETREKISAILYGGYATEEETLAIIQDVFEKYNYTVDTHTAVALSVYNQYVQETGDKTKTIIDATASPFKFNKSVLQGILKDDSVQEKDEFIVLEKLSEVSGLPVHYALKDLDKKPVLHDRACSVEEIPDLIKKILNIV